MITFKDVDYENLDYERLDFDKLTWREYLAILAAAFKKIGKLETRPNQKIHDIEQLEVQCRGGRTGYGNVKY